jgi:exopolysaccharide biosynthesis polyprenyl glycosylphosphotransferase
VQQGLSGGYESTDLAQQPGDDHSTLLLPDMRTALDQLDSFGSGPLTTVPLTTAPVVADPVAVLASIEPSGVEPAPVTLPASFGSSSNGPTVPGHAPFGSTVTGSTVFGPSAPELPSGPLASRPRKVEHVTVEHVKSERVTIERVTVKHVTTEYVTAEYVTVEPRPDRQWPDRQWSDRQWPDQQWPDQQWPGSAPPGYVSANHPPANHGPVYQATVHHPAAPPTPAQAQSTPAPSAPAQHAPSQHAPSHDTRRQDGDGWDAPTQQAPTQQAPTQQAPGQQASGQQAPTQHTPTQHAPTHDEPGQYPSARPGATGRDADQQAGPRSHKAGRWPGRKSTNKGPIIPAPATSAPGSPAPAGAAEHAAYTSTDDVTADRTTTDGTTTDGTTTEGTTTGGTTTDDRTAGSPGADVALRGSTGSALAGGPLTGDAPPGYVTPDNAPPLAGAGGRIPTDRARNRAVDRHWSPARNRSGAARPAIRPFIRIPGRHAAMSRRQAWETRYVRALLACDLAVGIGAGAVAFGLRFGDEVTTYNRGYVLLSVFLPVVLLLVLAFSRAYERRFLFVGSEEYQRVLRGGVTLIAGAAVFSYALDLDLARSYVLAALPTAIVGSVMLRYALRKRLHGARARGRSLRRVIVVGHELAVVGITRQLKRERYHGLEVVGACLPPHHDGNVGLPVYGTFDDVADAVEAAAADTVLVLSCPELDGVVLRRLAWRLERDEVDLIVASALIDVAGARTTIRPVDGLPMLHVEHPRLHGGARLVKDAVDRVGALMLTLLLLPVLLGVAVSVRVTSRGPVLFRQVRVGRDGREFRIFKFRSMYLDAEARLAGLRHLNEHDGLLFKIRDDPRVTPVGRWLRRLSLDELPQLLNVMAGQMSLVGPRPPLPVEVAAYADDVRRRLAVKPGMTGLWQVSGRSDLSWEEAVRLDLRYVENWSLSLDLVILLRTMTAVVRSSGAY